MKKIFIVWEKECTRSENLAKHFNAEIIHIFPFNSKGNSIKTLIRYFISIFITFYYLAIRKPKIIFTINLPLPLIITIFLYSKISNSGYILDSHSAAFTCNMWRRFLFIYEKISRNALLNLNTCKAHSDFVVDWGGKSEIISDVPIDFDSNIKTLSLPEKSILVVCSYNYDEPVENILESARITNDVKFYFSGNYFRLKDVLIENKPDNVEFLGFIPIGQYYSYLKSASAVMCLTNRDNTMQRGAYEALALEQPIITSKYNILVETFGNAAIYVNNSVDEINRAIYQIIEHSGTIKKAVKKQKQKRLKVFELTLKSIKNQLNMQDYD